MFAVGPDYHAQLEAYGQAIRGSPGSCERRQPDGMVELDGLLRGYFRGHGAHQRPLACRALKSSATTTFLSMRAMSTARGEYTTPNATQFPHGLLPVSQTSLAWD